MEKINKSTEIFGLSEEIRYKDGSLNDRDRPLDSSKSYLHSTIKVEFSEKNKKVLGDILSNNDIKNILEIGIARSRESSSTFHILNNKSDNTKYIGIDVNKDCVNQIRKWDRPNAHAFVCNSSDTEKIEDILRNLGVDELDLFIIDGYHSINQVYDDFKLAKKVKKGGYVLLHDTNYHPGPSNLLDSVDETIFEKKVYFQGEEDWGVATLKRII